MITVARGRIAVTDAYAVKDLLKQIPGARFDGDMLAWVFPASPVSARAIAAVAQHHPRSPEFEALIDGRLERADAARDATHLAPPSVRKTEPWLHQKQAWHFVKDLPGAILHMGVGTGKTKVAYDLLQNSGYKRALVVCPAGAMRVWPWQASLHMQAPYRMEVMSKGSIVDRVRRARVISEAARLEGVPFIAVTNYEAFAQGALRDFTLGRISHNGTGPSHPTEAAWDWVIFDEIHHLKAPGGIWSRHAALLADRIPKRLGLTGTLMHHVPLDVYGQFRAVDKAVFGTSFALFRARYAVMGGFGGYEVMSYQNQDEMRSRILSVTYEAPASVLDLPPATHTFRTCTLGVEARRIYDDLESDLYTAIAGGAVTAVNALSRLLRLRQITSGHVGVTVEGQEGFQIKQVDTAKERLLGEVLDELGPEPVVVFCVFTADLDAVHRQATALGLTSAELSGRRKELEQWQQGAAQVLAAQVQAGGEGIDLTRARVMVYYSMGFSLGEYRQTSGRVHRPGQERPVTYIHLLANDSVDWAVWKAVQRNEDIVESILHPKEELAE